MQFLDDVRGLYVDLPYVLLSLFLFSRLWLSRQFVVQNLTGRRSLCFFENADPHTKQNLILVLLRHFTAVNGVGRSRIKSG